MKIVVAFFLLALGFWAGHSYSSYRMEEQVIPTLQQFQALSSASLMLQGVDLIDSGETAALRGKLLAAAESQIDPLPHFPPSWGAVLAPPFWGSLDSIKSLRTTNDAQTSKLRERIRSLAQKADHGTGGSAGEG